MSVFAQRQRVLTRSPAIAKKTDRIYAYNKQLVLQLVDLLCNKSTTNRINGVWAYNR